MPMPHRTYKQVIQRRLVGKAGAEKTKELRAILAELPGYRNGPYADLRKWVEGQLVESRGRTKVIHRDSIGVRREGAAQIMFVGPPNAGKSSLLQALSSVQIRTGDYAFTTTRPVPAVTRIHDVLVQLVEIPGLLSGAHEDRGGGRALLGVLRGGDAVVLCHDAAHPEELDTIHAELAAAGIDKPILVVATRDGRDARAGWLPRRVGARRREPRPAPRRDLGPHRARPHLGAEAGEEQAEAVPLHPPATVADVAHAIHRELGRTCIGARVWGPSARFDAQRVGRGHVVADGDVIEVLTR